MFLSFVAMTTKCSKCEKLPKFCKCSNAAPPKVRALAASAGAPAMETDQPVAPDVNPPILIGETTSGASTTGSAQMMEVGAALIASTGNDAKKQKLDSNQGAEDINGNGLMRMLNEQFSQMQRVMTAQMSRSRLRIRLNL